MKMNYLKIAGAVIALTSAQAALAVPMNFSFQGTFAQDDEVQLFNFTADGASTVYLVSYAYGGGTQADGTVHTAGGMDTILTLFDSSGAYVDQNDDGPIACFDGAKALVPGIDAGNTDPTTLRRYDTCLSSALAAGTYTVAVTQYDNFAVRPNLSDGFTRDGQGNFTGPVFGCSNGSFCDITRANRTNVWAYDILNVDTADVVAPAPAPATLALLGLGLLGLGWSRRKA